MVNLDDKNLICFTIGHSRHSIEHFMQLLKMHKIDCLVDVRSSPYSQHVPQYNKELLMRDLEKGGILYVYMGDRLGGRYTNPNFLFSDGIVEFNKVRLTNRFNDGIEEVINRIKKGDRLVLMCSEKDPFDCHRFVLVAYALSLKGILVKHILENGEIILNTDLEKKLLTKYKKDYRQTLLFKPKQTREDALEEAYQLRNRDIINVMKVNKELKT